MNSQPKLPAFLTIKATADHLKLSEKSIRRMIKRRDLIAHRFGRQWRIDEIDLLAFVHRSRAMGALPARFD